MAYVHVDIDLDEFDTCDLVEELIGRMKSTNFKHQLSRDQKKELRKEFSVMSDYYSGIVNVDIKSLDDKCKIEHLGKVFNQYTLVEIEKLIPVKY